MEGTVRRHSGPVLALTAFFLLAADAAVAASAFQITFGARDRAARNWNGGIREASQVRRISGWHLDTADELIQPNRWVLSLRSAGGVVLPKSILVEVTSPESEAVTLWCRMGDFSFIPAEIPYGEVEHLDGIDVTVERVPLAKVISGGDYENDDPEILRTRAGEYWMGWVAYRTIDHTGYRIQGGDQVMVARSRDGASWSTPRPVTPPGDHFRVALGEDGAGRIWCVYALQKDPEGGDFDLFARVWDGAEWSDEERLTNDPRPDAFHRMASDSRGNLFLVWSGFRQLSEEALPQSEILSRVRSTDGWGEEINLSQSQGDDWEPAVATGPAGSWVAWDSYRSPGSAPATYDLLARHYSLNAGRVSLGEIREVSATPMAEMRADVAVDSAGRVWFSWEEGGANWGKDTGYENPNVGANLKAGGSEIYRAREGWYRRPRIAVLERGEWKQPGAELTDSLPDLLAKSLFQNPRLAVDGDGAVWVLLRHQAVSRGRNGGHLFDFYATTLQESGGAQRWMTPVLLPHTTGRQDTVISAVPGPKTGLLVGTVSDGRLLPVGLPEHHDIAAVSVDADLQRPASPDLTRFRVTVAPDVPVTHPEEALAVARIRDHRIETADGDFKIIRGDLHRHSEISMDGATDGSLWDLYRYALDAASFDFFAVTDHNYGAWLDTDEPESPNTDDIYQWWRTQKSADLFHVPGRFVPLYGYERSVNFPLGHVNVFHPRRGVFSYRVSKLHLAERPELLEKEARGFQAYLAETGGVGIAHTSGTIMGTDWKLHDDSVIPVTEIYQGDRSSYEAEGAPRAATPEEIGLGGAGRPPFQQGLVSNALSAGFRMGFIASSDHYSTHISYANLLVPEGVTTRQDIQAAIEERRTYGSTDNIIVDFRAGDTLMGGVIEASSDTEFTVEVTGAGAIQRVDVIKNNEVFYSHRAEGSPSARRKVSFTFRPRPPLADGYYYIRVVESFSSDAPDRPGEIAWSSPIYVTP